jgi:four helix bundle protein
VGGKGVRGYRATRCLRRDDQFAIGHQIRKAAVWIPSNIAEGFGRHFTADYTRYLRIANGSNNELQTQIDLSRRLELIASEEATELMAQSEEVGRMLRALLRSLSAR